MREWLAVYFLRTRIGFHKSLNGFVHFLRKLPLIGQHLGGQYRFRAIKRLSDGLTPLTLGVGALGKAALSTAIAILALTTNLLWIEDLLGPVWSSVGMDKMAFSFQTGLFWLIYSTIPRGYSILSGVYDEYHFFVRDFQIAPRAVYLSLTLVHRFVTFIARTIIWILFSVFFPQVWPLASAVLWSILLLLVEIVLDGVRLPADVSLDAEKSKPLLRALSQIVLTLVFGGAMLYSQFLIMPYLWMVVLALLVPAGFFLRHLLAFDDFGALMERAAAVRESVQDLEHASRTVVQDEVRLEDKDLKRAGRSDLSGYARLNDLFFRRHKRILWKPIWIKSAICVVLLTGFTLFSWFKANDVTADEFIKLVFLVPFAMYLLCNNARLTRAMYLNCDQGLLSYGFFKEPDAVLALFKERLKSFWRLHLLPIAVVFVFLLVNGLYLGLAPAPFVAILSMPIVYGAFFTIYPLLLYYFFQPYNVDGQVESWGVNAFHFGVYALCILIFPQLADDLSPVPFAVGTLVLFLLSLPIIFRLVKTVGPKVMRKE